MRYVLALLAIFLTRSALAEDPGARLFGSWRLISFQLKIVGEEGEPRTYLVPIQLGRSSFLQSIVSSFLYREQTDAPQPTSLRRRRSSLR